MIYSAHGFARDTGRSAEQKDPDIRVVLMVSAKSREQIGTRNFFDQWSGGLVAI